MNNQFKIFIIALFTLVLTACSGGTNTSATSFELHDPNATANNRFGEKVVILPNGNIVVYAPNDSSVASSSGAVHLYNPSQKLIASLYGDTAGDRLGDSITALANNNFVVASSNDDEGGIVNAGTVRLIDGTTGVQIGSTLAGERAGDRLGDSITALANNNFVVVSKYDYEGGIASAGSVRLVSGTTGAQLGILAGDVAGDFLGSDGITVLANNNFVVASRSDDEGGIVNAGSVRLVDGTTGSQIGSTFAGDVVNDLELLSITTLTNNNFVISSYLDDEGGIVDAGLVRLVDGTSGAQLWILAGDVADDFLGSGGITALANNNFVIASPNDDENSIVDAGSVRLIDGTTGAQIGSTLTGDVTYDQLGASSITALANNNFVVASQNDIEGGLAKAGSVRLVDGTTGMQIGSALTGDVAYDNLGSSGITVLANNNYVVSSSLDDENSIFDAGSVRLVNGTTGVQIGILAGDASSDNLGSSGITALANNNFVVASQNDDENSRVDAGSVRLVDGTTGAQIGSTLAGDVAYDKLGMTSITALANDNFVVVSQYDDEGGINNAGSVRLVSGTTGAQIGSTLAGDVASDRLGNAGITALANSNFVVASYQDDENSIVDAGSIRQMDGETGNQIRTIVGSAVGDISSSVQVIELSSGDFYILSLPHKDHNAIVDSGFVTLIPTQ